MFEQDHERFESLQDAVCRDVLSMASDVGYVYARDVQFELELNSGEVTDAFAALAEDGLVELVGMSVGQAAVVTTRGQWVAMTRFETPTDDDGEAG